jgi:hypothetical protein
MRGRKGNSTPVRPGGPLSAQPAYAQADTDVNPPENPDSSPHTRRSHRSQSERLSRPTPGQHTRPPPLGRPRPSRTPSRGARGPPPARPPRRRVLSGECQPAGDDQATQPQPNLLLGLTARKPRTSGPSPVQQEEQGRCGGCSVLVLAQAPKTDGSQKRDSASNPSPRPCSRGPTRPKAKATTKDQRSGGRSEAKTLAGARTRDHRTSIEYFT